MRLGQQPLESYGFLAPASPSFDGKQNSCGGRDCGVLGVRVLSQAWALGPQARHSSVLWPGVKNIYIALLPSRPWPALVVSWGVVLQSTLL